MVMPPTSFKEVAASGDGILSLRGEEVIEIQQGESVHHFAA